MEIAPRAPPRSLRIQEISRLRNTIWSPLLRLYRVVGSRSLADDTPSGAGCASS